MDVDLKFNEKNYLDNDISARAWHDLPIVQNEFLRQTILLSKGRSTVFASHVTFLAARS